MVPLFKLNVSALSSQQYKSFGCETADNRLYVKANRSAALMCVALSLCACVYVCMCVQRTQRLLPVRQLHRRSMVRGRLHHECHLWIFALLLLLLLMLMLLVFDVFCRIRLVFVCRLCPLHRRSTTTNYNTSSSRSCDCRWSQQHYASIGAITSDHDTPQCTHATATRRRCPRMGLGGSIVTAPAHNNIDNINCGPHKPLLLCRHPSQRVLNRAAEAVAGPVLCARGFGTLCGVFACMLDACVCACATTRLLRSSVAYAWVFAIRCADYLCVRVCVGACIVGFTVEREVAEDIVRRATETGRNWNEGTNHTRNSDNALLFYTSILRANTVAFLFFYDNCAP